MSRRGRLLHHPWRHVIGIVKSLAPALAAGVAIALFPEAQSALWQGGPPHDELSEGVVWACRVGGMALASIAIFVHALPGKPND